MQSRISPSVHQPILEDRMLKPCLNTFHAVLTSIESISLLCLCYEKQTQKYHHRKLEKQDRRTLPTCAWRRLFACDLLALRPWLRGHAWREGQSTHSNVLLEVVGMKDIRELTAASLVFSELRRFNARRWRLCWRRWGVTRRWIFGALVYGFFPSPFGWTSRRMTNLRT